MNLKRSYPGPSDLFFGGETEIHNDATPAWMKDQLPLYVPETMVYNKPYRMPKLTRMECRQPPENGVFGSSPNTTLIRFPFPNSKPIDFRGGFITFNITITTTGGTYKRLAQGAWSIIDKVRIVFGDMEDDINDYNRCFSFRWNTLVDPAVQSTIGYDLLGLGLQSDRNTWGASASGTQYIIPFDHGMLRKGIVPMNGLDLGRSNNNLYIEFTIGMATSFVETDGTNPIITVNNMNWHHTTVSSADGRFEQAMYNLARSGRYKVGFETISLCKNMIVNQTADIQIQHRGNAVNYLDTIFMDAATINTTTVNDKFTTWPRTLSNGVSLLNYQLQIDQVWFPSEPISTIDDAFRAYVAYLNRIGVWAMDGVGCKFGAPIGLTAFNNDQFFMPIDLRSTPKEWLDKSESFNNLSFRNAAMILLKVNLSGTPPAQTTLYTFISNNILLVADTRGNLQKLY